MEYTVIINDRSYDLPKKTIDVVDKVDTILKVDASNLSVRQKYEKLHRFTKEILGEDNTKEILGSDNLSAVDLSELTLTVRMIIDAYDKPISDYESEKRMRSLDSLPIDKIASLSKAAENIISFSPKN